MSTKTTSKPLSEYKNNIGNGAWFLLHTIAEAAQTPALMQAYAHNFRNLCGKMTACGCEDHCRIMLEELPPEKYFHLLDEDGIPDGCLRHSVECHNRVNARLGKPVYPYEVIKKLYRSKEAPAPCMKGGAGEAAKESHPPAHSHSHPNPHHHSTHHKKVVPQPVASKVIKGPTAQSKFRMVPVNENSK